MNNLTIDVGGTAIKRGVMRLVVSELVHTKRTPLPPQKLGARGNTLFSIYIKL